MSHGRTVETVTSISSHPGTNTQWMVDVAVDNAGAVHAAWEDNRNSAWNIFYSNSTDGGNTWGANLRVSSEDTPLSYNRPGDYFAIEAGPDNKIYVVWTDGRGTDFDIYYARNPGFPTSTVTVTTNPTGLPVTVDGVTSTAPVATAWLIGSSHTVSVASAISLGPTARYFWSDWSDGGAISHSIVTGTNDTTITASFTKQYQSRVSLVPTGLGLSVLVDSVSYTAATSFWWDDGTVHQVEAPTNQTVSADVRYVWFSWSDGGSAVHSVTANAALVLTATFTEEQAMRVSTTPSGASFLVDDQTYSSATTFWFARDSYHIVSVVTPQSGIPGTRYQFQNWSDGGAATHVIHFTSAASLQATFSAEYYLTVTSPVAGAGGSGWYPAGATVSASVSNQYYAQGPGERLSFRGWSGDATGGKLTSDPILMDGPKTARAQYGTQFYLDVSSAYGEVAGAGWYDAGTNAVASLTSGVVAGATGTRSVFVSWNGDTSGTDPSSSQSILMNGPHTVGTTWRTEYELRIDSTYGSVVGGGRGLVSSRVLCDSIPERERDRDGLGCTGRLQGVDRGRGRQRRVRFESDPHVRAQDRASAVVEGVSPPDRFGYRHDQRDRMVWGRRVRGAPRLDGGHLRGPDVPFLRMVGRSHIRAHERDRHDDGTDDRPSELDDDGGPRRTVRHRDRASPSRDRDRPRNRAPRRERAPAPGVMPQGIPSGATPSSSCTDRTSRRSGVRRRRTRPRNR